MGITLFVLCKTRGLSQLLAAHRPRAILDRRSNTFGYSDSVTHSRPHLPKAPKVPLDKMAVSR